MRVGNKVEYLHDRTYIGVIIAIGSNLFKVKWNKGGIEEWMPEYALEIISTGDDK